MSERWQVEFSTHTGGGLFELETTETWLVRSVATGEVVARFTSESSASYDGVGWSGGGSDSLRQVTIEGDEAVLTHRDGQIVRVPLPPP